jgi:hypothetical protein
MVGDRVHNFTQRIWHVFIKLLLAHFLGANLKHLGRYLQAKVKEII